MGERRVAGWLSAEMPQFVGCILAPHQSFDTFWCFGMHPTSWQVGKPAPRQIPHNASQTKSPTSRVPKPIFPAAWLFILVPVTD